MRGFKAFTYSVTCFLGASVAYAGDYTSSSGFNPGEGPTKGVAFSRPSRATHADAGNLASRRFPSGQALSQPPVRLMDASPPIQSVNQQAAPSAIEVQAVSHPSPLPAQPVPQLSAPPVAPSPVVSQQLAASDLPVSQPAAPIAVRARPVSQPSEPLQPQPVPQPVSASPALPQQTMPADVPVPDYPRPRANHAPHPYSELYAVKREEPRKQVYIGLRAAYGTVGDAEGSQEVSPGVVDRGTLEFDNGAAIGFVAGAQLFSFLRVEGEASYQDYEAKSGLITRSANGVVALAQPIDEDDLGFKAWTAMMNGYVDVPLTFTERFIPYAGAGAGWMFQRNGSKNNAFAYQLMTGINMSLNNHQTSIGLGYRYLTAPDIIDSPLLPFDAESQQVELTLKQYF